MFKAPQIVKDLVKGTNNTSFNATTSKDIVIKAKRERPQPMPIETGTQNNMIIYIIIGIAVYFIITKKLI
jgi:capsular polysaccharide biosynthesis protein